MVTPVTLRKPEHSEEACMAAGMSTAELLGRIGGKWTIFVIVMLSEGPQRFSELKRRIEGVSQKVLTSTLRDLERDGFITRKVTPSIPPRVDYALTELGQDLCAPLMALSSWAVVNRGRVEAARESFEARQAEEPRKIAYFR
jgi:DNA-binding HxlR family transcriptional regulator